MPYVMTWLSAYNEEVMKFEARLQTKPLKQTKKNRPQ